MNQTLDQTIPYVVEQRRRFHRIPEVSQQEEKTSRAIQEELTLLGIPYDLVGDYGVIGRVEGETPGGKTIALRADIDALPMEEETDLPFCSEHPGVMHSCGHDGHIAVLLATGKRLMAQKQTLCGTVLLCFQQAEELGIGQEPVITYLKARGDVSGVFSTHLWADIPTGQISVEEGAVMAGTTSFYLTVTGKGCHGSRPDQGLDPINAAVTLIGDVLRLKDREVNPLCSNTLSFGMFHGGTATNIIPSQVELGGTLRFFSEEERLHLLSILERGCQSAQLLTGCTVACRIGVGLPPVVNAPACVAPACKAARRVYGEDKIITFGRIMASDNFGCYLQEFPGLYSFVGVGNPDKGACYAHHNCKFDLDEDALEPAVDYQLQTILEVLGGTEQ